MHFEILVEDLSGKKLLDVLVPQIVGRDHTFKVIPYKGVGRIPKGLRGKTDPTKRVLFDQLPRLLQGYGKSLANIPAAVVLVCDLDDNCLKVFRSDLLDCLQRCNPRPRTRFCIAIEESEAWLLGDQAAIRKAYPNAKEAVLSGYANDAICGTWETMANALYPGGTARLKARGGQATGIEKSQWAERIGALMDVEENLSPSFCYFRGRLRELASGTV